MCFNLIQYNDLNFSISNVVLNVDIRFLFFLCFFLSTFWCSFFSVCTRFGDGVKFQVVQQTLRVHVSRSSVQSPLQCTRQLPGTGRG